MTNSDFHSLHHSGRRKRNLFAHALDDIGSRIVRGDFQPGAILPNEAELGTELGISRSVVREAVKSLAAKGLLEARPRVGTRVLPSKHWNLLDLDVLSWRYAAMPRMQFFRELFELRRMIEPPAAALAAERATEDDRRTLAEAYRAMTDASPGSQAAIEADVRFHSAILAAGHNDLLLQMSPLIGVGLLVSFRISSRSFDIFLPLHERVLDAIFAGGAEDARAAMETLLSDTHEFLARELAGTERREKLLARTRALIEEGLSDV
jgi:GntR family transcriptional regulator, galactonate operon transcriptional repressor